MMDDERSVPPRGPGGRVGHASGIVPGGDRAAGGRRLRPLAAFPPRELPGPALALGCLRNSVALKLALGLTLSAGTMFAVPFMDRTARGAIPAWIPASLAVVALALWMLGVRDLRRARLLLEGGMPAKATIAAVRVNLLMQSNGRSRTTVEYDWTFAGQTRHAKTRGFLGRRERALVVGEELALVCDPSTPEEHLVPLFYGFRLEGF
jgi:hypothetical protein